MCSTYYALCSSQERRAVHFTPHIELVERLGKSSFLLYIAAKIFLKNSSRRTQGKKGKRKRVFYHWCFVRLLNL